MNFILPTHAISVLPGPMVSFGWSQERRKAGIRGGSRGSGDRGFRKAAQLEAGKEGSEWQVHRASETPLTPKLLPQAQSFCFV